MPPGCGPLGNCPDCPVLNPVLVDTGWDDEAVETKSRKNERELQNILYKMKCKPILTKYKVSTHILSTEAGR